MTLSRIILRLARNPGAVRAEPDDHRGYSLVAPLTQDGHLDAEAFATHRAACTVHRFAPDEETRDGRLNRHGGLWVFDYGQGEDQTEEPVYRLGAHRFQLGDYVSITDTDGETLTYKVTESARA